MFGIEMNFISWARGLLGEWEVVCQEGMPFAAGRRIDNTSLKFKDTLMIRSLAFTIAASLIYLHSVIASAHGGAYSHIPSGCGCSDRAYNVPSNNRLSLPSSGCPAGVCPTFDWQSDSAIQWYGSPAGRTYNVAPSYRDSSPYAPLRSQPLTPPTVSDPYSPPLPTQINSAPMIPQGMEGIAQLPIAEQRIALQQRTCPVTKQPLGSMGKPIRVSVTGRSVYVCCQGCVDALRKNPAQYLTSGMRHKTLIR